MPNHSTVSKHVYVYLCLLKDEGARVLENSVAYYEGHVKRTMI